MQLNTADTSNQHDLQTLLLVTTDLTNVDTFLETNYTTTALTTPHQTTHHDNKIHEQHLQTKANPPHHKTPPLTTYRAHMCLSSPERSQMTPGYV